MLPLRCVPPPRSRPSKPPRPRLGERFGRLSAWWQWHGPVDHPGEFAAFVLVGLVLQVGLANGLTADAQSPADRGPRMPFTACSCNQLPDRIVDVVLGVSRIAQVLQVLLRATADPVELLDRLADQPPRVTAFLVAHQAMKTDVADNSSELAAPGREYRFPAGISACCELADDIGRPPDRRACRGVPLITRYISPQGPIYGLPDNRKRNDPAARQRSGSWTDQGY